MKKGFIKVTVIALALMLVLTGCFNKKGKGSDSDVKTLQVYQIGDAPKNIDQLTDAINKISEEKIGVKVKFNYIGWGDYEQKMSVMVTAGDEFDIAFASNYAINAQKGAYADLTDLVKEHAKEFFGSVDEAYYKGNLVNGKLYAFPVNGNVFASQMLTFNGDLLDKHNIDISNIKTYADAEAALAIIKEKEPEVAGFPIGSTFRMNFGDFDFPLAEGLPFAVNLNGDKTKIVNPFETTEGRTRLLEMHNLYKKGYIPSDAATSSTSYDLNLNTWFMRQETQGPADYGDHLLSQVAGKSLRSVPLNGKLKSVQQAQMANFVVAQNSKYKVEAVKWLNLLNTTPEMMDTLIYGIEGEAWEKVGDKHVKLLDAYKPNMHMAPWNTGNSAIIRQPESITDEMIAQREAMVKEAIASPVLGFTPNTDGVKTEISNILNVMSEYGPVLFTGTVNPDEKVPEFIEKLKAAGYDKVQAELQKQYTDFLAKS